MFGNANLIEYNVIKWILNVNSLCNSFFEAPCLIEADFSRPNWRIRFMKFEIFLFFDIYFELYCVIKREFLEIFTSLCRFSKKK